MNKTLNINIITTEYEPFQLEIQQLTTYKEMIKQIAHILPEIKNNEIILMKNGKPIENETKLQEGEDILMFQKIKSEKLKLNQKNELNEQTIEKDETPLTEEEMMKVYEKMTENEKEDILILQEIGFDLVTCVVMFCMCKGNKELAVNKLLMGDVYTDMKVITEFLIKKYPNAVKQVRPTLLTRRRSFTSSAPRRTQESLEELLYRTLLNNGRINDLLNSYENEFLSDDSEESE